MGDYQGRLYKEKSFISRFIIFVHLITTKVSGFRSILAYNSDFQIILDELCSLGDFSPGNLKLAAYCHCIKESYPDFTTTYNLTFETNMPIISNVIAKLKYKRHEFAESIIMSI